MMKKVKIVLDRTACINCSACVPEDSARFTEDEKREVHLNNTGAVNGKEELALELSDEEYNRVKNAASICPVDAISAIDL